jgi:hypothetical protein
MDERRARHGGRGMAAKVLVQGRADALIVRRLRVDVLRQEQNDNR